MALTRYRDGDERLGQIVSIGGRQAIIPAALLVDASGNAVSSATTTPALLLSSAASDNATAAFAVACELRHVIGKSARASICYLKLYDKATTPTSGDTPKLVIPIDAGVSIALDFPRGVSFAAGLGYRIVTGSPHADTGVIAAGDILGLNLVVA